MSEILPGVHTIDGIGPSPEFTTNVLLLKNAKGGTWTLLDTGLPGGEGYPGAAALIESYCKSQKIPLNAIKNILITHLHRDHTGNLPLLAKMTGAKTYAHWLEAAFIASKPPYKGPGMPPLEPFEVSERLRDGDEIEAFDGLITVDSPGHTPGHVAFHCPSRKILFSGDAVFNTGSLVVSMPQFTFSNEMALISLRRLAELDVESVIVYHGAPVLKGGRTKLAEAARAAGK